MPDRRIGTARASLEFAPGARVTFEQKLEVSLDCYVCRRRDRTVVFRADEAAGICTPTRHPFPGRMLSFESGTQGNTHVASISFEYDYERFGDAKYPDEQRYIAFEPGAPSWARVSFEVTCPACERRSGHSTQNNIVRPWRCACSCGHFLYSETTEMPQLSWHPAAPNPPSE